MSADLWPYFPSAARSSTTVAPVLTAAGLRAGMPTLILWDVADQPIWAGAVQRLKSALPNFTNITRDSLLRSYDRSWRRNAAGA